MKYTVIESIKEPSPYTFAYCGISGKISAVTVFSDDSLRHLGESFFVCFFVFAFCITLEWSCLLPSSFSRLTSFLSRPGMLPLTQCRVLLHSCFLRMGQCASVCMRLSVPALALVFSSRTLYMENCGTLIARVESEGRNLLTFDIPWVGL